MGMQNSKYLVAGYPFENSGADIKGSHPLTVNGATYVAGKIGNCPIFDGIDDHCAGGNILNPGLSDFTVSIWVNPASIQSPIMGICGKSNANGTLPRWSILYIGADLYAIYNDILLAIPATNTPLNQWTHVLVVYQRNSTMRLYINTVLKNSISIFTYQFTDHQSTWNFYIGSYQNALGTAPQYYFKGKLDLFKYYNKTLTQQEIQRDYLNLPII